MSIGIDTHVNVVEDVESCVLDSMEQLCRSVERRVYTVLYSSGLYTSAGV